MRRLALAALAGLLIAGIVAAPAAARRPGPTIVETAIAANAPGGVLEGQLDTLISLVVAYDLADTLNGNRQFTVFAPTDAAFDALFAVVDPSKLTDAQIKDILLYHVTNGRRMASSVLGADQIRMLNRDSIIPSVRNGDPYVNDSKITTANIKTSNGIIHVIDAVLIP
jgi:uncharacterized surface protein with fasciclin (FAS1) repeats